MQQSFVIILETFFQNVKCIKCVISNTNNDKDILDAHKRLYEEKSNKFVILEKLKVYNTKLFLEYLDKLSQFRVSFVTVSFENAPHAHKENKLPCRFFCDSQKDLIISIIDTINKLCAIVSSGIGIDFYNTSTLKINEVGNTTRLFICKPKPVFSTDPCLEKYLTFVNDDFFYNTNDFINLFPEFDISSFNFPKNQLALNMFEYKIEKGCQATQIISDINDFFQLEFGNESEPHFLQVSELQETDLTTDVERKEIIKKFIDTYIEKINGKKIQSDLMFKTFLSKMGLDDKQFTQTRFGKIIKNMLESKRENTAVYFQNVQFKQHQNIKLNLAL